MSNKYVKVDDVMNLINTTNRGSCDYFIVDEIEELCNSNNIYNIDKVVEELEENCVMRANSKTFYDNPQKGEYVDEVVLLNKTIEIVKRGGKND